MKRMFNICSSLFILALLSVSHIAANNKRPDNAKVTAEMPLLSVNGRVVLTHLSFNDHLKSLLQTNPYLRSFTPETLPLAAKKEILERYLENTLRVEKAKQSKVDETEAFSKQFKAMQKQLRENLLTAHYEKSMIDAQVVSENEVVEYYEKNRELLVERPRALNLEGTSFTDRVKADEFAAKLGSDSSSFKKQAEEVQDGTYQSFGLVSTLQQGNFAKTHHVSEKLHEAIQSVESAPTIVRAIDGDKQWVLHVKSIQDRKFYPLEAVKDDIKSFLATEQAQQLISEELKNLRATSKVVIDPLFLALVEEDKRTSAQKSALSKGTRERRRKR